MKKSAFTMMELVFVIVVIGILAAVAIPSFDRDKAGEAAYQIARHIRLAQHHAMIDDTFGDTGYPTNSYNITFATTKYTVAKGATAINDSLTRKPLLDVNMVKIFGLTNISPNPAACSTIAFDHLGRPYTSTDISTTPMSSNCVITITTNDGHNAVITVYPESGYTKVTSIDGHNIP